MAPALIFPGIAKDQPLSEQAVGKAISRDLEGVGVEPGERDDAKTGGLVKAGINEAFTPHDLRRTVGTHLAAMGFSTVVPFVLGHTPKTVTGIHYDHHNYLAEKRKALESWAQRLDAIVSGDVAQIVEIRHYRGGRLLPEVSHLDFFHPEDK